jgi:Peptidase M1 N-terminal domain
MFDASNKLISFPLKPTDARRAFPCWDEPLLKATFAITMISKHDTVNLSNMPVISEEVYKRGSNVENDSLLSQFSDLSIKEPEHQWKITRFDTTPPVSLDSLVPAARSPMYGNVDVDVPRGICQWYF